MNNQRNWLRISNWLVLVMFANMSAQAATESVLTSLYEARSGPIIKYELEPESSILIYPRAIGPDEDVLLLGAQGITEQLSGYFAMQLFEQLDTTVGNPATWDVTYRHYKLLDLEFNSPSVRIGLSPKNFNTNYDVGQAHTFSWCLHEDGLCRYGDVLGTPSPVVEPLSINFSFYGDYFVGHEIDAIPLTFAGFGTFTTDSADPDTISILFPGFDNDFPEFNSYGSLKLRANRQSISVPEINQTGLPLAICLLFGLAALFRERYDIRDTPDLNKQGIHA